MNETYRGRKIRRIMQHRFLFLLVFPCFSCVFSGFAQLLSNCAVFIFDVHAFSLAFLKDFSLRPDQKSSQKPSQKPGQKPGQKPFQKSGQRLPWQLNSHWKICLVFPNNFGSIFWFSWFLLNPFWFQKVREAGSFHSSNVRLKCTSWCQVMTNKLHPTRQIL